MNSLDCLNSQRKQVSAYASHFGVPLDNNQAERNLRMVKVQQKVSGWFRSQEGAAYFFRIRVYISTIKKQAENIFVTLCQTI